MSQHKRARVVNKIIWIDDYITVETADYTNRSFVAVCCSTENQVIAPCAILFHASQVISPRWVSMDKVEQICSIGLCERKEFEVNRPRSIYQYSNWLRGFRVKIANFSSFFCLSIPKKRPGHKENNTNGCDMLQEVHCSENTADLWACEWGYKTLFSCCSSNKVGVSILFNNTAAS